VSGAGGGEVTDDVPVGVEEADRRDRQVGDLLLPPRARRRLSGRNTDAAV